LRGDSVGNEYIELEWAEMVRGVEEEKKLAKSIGFLDMFRGKQDYKRPKNSIDVLQARIYVAHFSATE
jgi:hypothetical protein